eukprot:409987_1
MWYALAFIVVCIEQLVELRAVDIKTEISNQVATTQRICDGFGDEYDSLGTTLNNALTSIGSTTTTITEQVNYVNTFADNMTSIENILAEINVLQEEMFDVSNTVKEIVNDTQNSVSIFVDSSINSAHNEVNERCQDLTLAVPNDFASSSNNIDQQFAKVAGNLVNEFLSIVTNVDEQFEYCGKDLETKFHDLKHDIAVLQTDVEGSVLQIKQSVGAARENIKMYIGLIWNYGYSAKSQGIITDHVLLENKETDELVIELSKKDLYMLVGALFAINLVFDVMIILLIAQCYDGCKTQQKSNF